MEHEQTFGKVRTKRKDSKNMVRGDGSSYRRDKPIIVWMAFSFKSKGTKLNEIPKTPWGNFKRNGLMHMGGAEGGRNESQGTINQEAGKGERIARVGGWRI